MLKPYKFESLFIHWVNSLKSKEINKEAVSIDGKTLPGFKDSFHEKSAVHTVSGWTS